MPNDVGRDPAFAASPSSQSSLSRPDGLQSGVGSRLGWHVPDNLRWLAEQSERPAYMPCGALTGVFLKQAADMFEALARERAE